MSNELFVTLVQEATAQAIKTHKQEKISVLRNAVVNGVVDVSSSEDIKLRFLSYIDEFTPTHLAILRYMEILAISCEKLESYEHFYQSYLKRENADISRPHFKLCCDEISMRKLGYLVGMDGYFDDISGAAPEHTANVQAHVILTELGRKFLALISTPPQWEVPAST